MSENLADLILARPSLVLVLIVKEFASRVQLEFQFFVLTGFYLTRYAGLVGRSGDAPRVSMGYSTSARADLVEKINSFEYWHYPFDLGDGVIITPPLAEQKRQLRDFIWPVVLGACGGNLDGLRVIDVGCNAGFWSLEAHKSGASYVLGIEARPAQIAQAELVRDALGIDARRLEYQRMSIYDLSRARVGEYDVCLLFRILQHLRHPLLALERVREVCRARVIVDVAVIRQEKAMFYLHNENTGDPLHGIEGVALQPSRQAVEEMLACCGFTDVQGIPPKPPLEKSYFSGKRVLFTARVGQSSLA